MAPFPRTTLPAHLKPEYRAGRPSEYRPEFCRMVIETMGNEGLSLAAFAGSILVSRNTVYEWIGAHAEFADAVTRAQTARQLFLERKLMRSRKGAETMAASFALKNAAPDDWRDVRSVSHSHSVNLDDLTDAQLYAIAAGRAEAPGTVIDGEFRRTEKNGTG